MERNISKHISKGNIQVKMKQQPSSKPVNRSHNSGSYKLYLKSGGSNLPKVNQEKSKDGNKKVNIQRKKQKVNKESTIRIIRQQDKSSKSKNKFTRKKPSKIRDINEIEKQIERQNELKQKVKQKEVKQKIDKKDNKDKKHNKRLSKRSNKRKIRRSTKRNSKNVRKFSIKKHKKVSENDMKRVEQKINSIRNKKSSEIKKELEKEGIKVSGKSNRLLKDIYFYSKVCNINIKHE